MDGLPVFTLTMTISFVMMHIVHEDEGCKRINVTMGCPVFNCSHLHRNTIPRSLPRDTCKLYLQGNKITVLPAGSIKRYRKLTLLDLSQNKIHEIQEGAFDGAEKLLTLFLHDNALHFTNSYPKIFKPLRKLERLTLHCNNLSDYADEVLSDLTSLRQLQMDGLKNRSFGAGYGNLSNLHTLTFSGRCNIQWLTKDTFRNVTHLRKLNVSSCNVTTVEADTLTPLKNLTTLDISKNRALKLEGLENITNGLKDTAIRKLFVNEIMNTQKICNIIRAEHIRNLQNTSILEIHANDNGLTGFGEKTLEVLPPTLKRTYLLFNRFSYGPYLHDLQNLLGLEVLILNGKLDPYHILPFGTFSLRRALHMNYNLRASNLNDIQVKCADASDIIDNQGDGFVQTLSSGLRRFRTSHKHLLHVPPNLTKFEYTYSELSFCISEIHFGENNLQIINVSSNVLTIWQGPIYGLHKLTHLSLSNNIAQSVSTYFFSQLPQLIHLDISLNYLGLSIANDRNGEIFENLTRLKFLNLSQNGIEIVPKQLFRGLRSLSTLDLSMNRINNFPSSIAHTSLLSTLILNKNEMLNINTRDLTLVEKIVKNRNFTIDVSDNPFSCVCQLIPFLNWLGTTSVKIENYDRCNCSYEGSAMNIEVHRVDIIRKLSETCSTHSGLTMGIVLLLFFLTLIVIVSAVVYRYRWKLSYLYYATRLRFKADKADELEYDYDAFVSFADEDRSFVFDELIPSLETGKGLHLNIHNRDFLPGRPIVESIIDAIQRSRKTILVLTPEFLKSTWCRYELEMATMERVTTDRDILVILVMGHIPKSDVPPEIFYHLHTNTYLEYPDDGQTGQFWTALSHSITTT
ncbi:toll-like receptor 4 [Haliotis asinina]|uniref:toll-like receptor 4 n=1 Tax=Haliotis asinina TaxID=109174 RepID=UPI00353192CF